MQKTSKTWFSQHPKAGLLILYVVFLIVLELCLQLFFGQLIFDKKPPPISLNKLVHHDYIPNSEFTSYPLEGDTYPPSVVNVNSYGIRGPEIAVKKTYRVLLLGDSFLQADEVVFEKTFGEKLDRYFEGKIEFISHGMSSWSPTPIFSWLYHKGLALQPDEVHLFLVVNDFYREEVYSLTDEVYRRQANYEGNIPVQYLIPEKDRLKGILKISAIVYMLHKGFILIKELTIPDTKKFGMRDELILLAKDENEWPTELKDNVDKTIDVVIQMDEYLRVNKIVFYVNMVPLGFSWQDETVYGKQHPTYGWEPDFTVSQAGIEAYLRKRLSGISGTWINLRDPIAERKRTDDQLLYNIGDGHWNEHGHEVIYSVFRDLYVKKLNTEITK